MADRVHSLIGVVFGLFCSFMIIIHIYTPENPDHILNLAMHPTLAILFFISATVSFEAAGVIQVFAMSLGAFLVATTGSFHPAGSVGIVALLLFYGYGGFVTIGGYSAIIAVVLQFGNVWLATWIAKGNALIAIAHAIGWTAASVLVIFLIWGFYQLWALKLIKQNIGIVKQNRELLEMNKLLKKGRSPDATERR